MGFAGITCVTTRQPAHGTLTLLRRSAIASGAPQLVHATGACMARCASGQRFR